MTNYLVKNISKAWKEHIEQKLSKIPSGKKFIFYTDAHEGDIHEGGMGKGYYESLGIVDYTSKIANIKNVIYGGDILGAEKTIDDAKKYLNKFLIDKGSLYDRFGGNAILNIGNHDTNCVAWTYTKLKRNGYNPENKLADLLIRDSFMYENYIKPMEASGNVKYDNIGINAITKYLNEIDIEELRKIYSFLGYDGHTKLSECELRQFFIRESEALFKFHFTYTDEECKIKYIVIDCGTNSPMQYGVIKQDYTDIFHIQFYWLAYELMNTPAEYDIVVTSHMFGDNAIDNCPYEAADLYRNLEQQIYDITNITAPIYKILTTYKAAASVKMPDSSNVQQSNVILKQIVNYIQNAYEDYSKQFRDGLADFSIGNKAKKIITICGHWHDDRLFYVSQDMKVTEYNGEKITDQIPVIFTAASSVARKSQEIYMSNEAPYSACFDVITFTEEKVVLTRIGAGEDREIIYHV